MLLTSCDPVLRVEYESHVSNGQARSCCRACHMTMQLANYTRSLDAILTRGKQSVQASPRQLLNQTTQGARVTELWVVQVCQARIANVEVPNNKCIRYSLQYIYGVGDATAQKILSATGIDPTKRTYQLAEEELASIRDELENYTTEGDLRRIVIMNIKRCARSLSPVHCTAVPQPGWPVSRNATQSQLIHSLNCLSIYAATSHTACCFTTQCVVEHVTHKCSSLELARYCQVG
jgi:ribosomal protein S13